MPGMRHSPGFADWRLVQAFRATLLAQGVLALFIFVVLACTWVGLREWLRTSHGAALAVRRAHEPAGRRLLRAGFGVLWIVDGVLQAQPAMVSGLPGQVTEPSAAGSPGWVHDLVYWASGIWSHHPVQAATAVVWIQLGIGTALLAARGSASRAAGAACAVWGLVVWVFGESFGGIFAPGLSWLFGAPGAAALYCVAGVLVALPERYWQPNRLGRLIVAGSGALCAGMAVLQAWPGRGFWHGAGHGRAGTLAGMVTSMAGTPQPRLTHDWVAAFAVFAAHHEPAVNLVAVGALTAAAAGLAAALATGSRAMTWAAASGLLALCLADWVLVQDLGIFGGLGTDPGSVPPMALLVIAGCLAFTAEPARPTPAAARPPAPMRDRIRPGALARSLGAAPTGAVLAAWAGALVILGAVPMALAQTGVS